MQFGTAQTYFTSLEKQIAPESPVWDYQSIAKGYTAPPPVAGKVDIPTWKSELYFEYHRGVMTTQANHKRNMREAEEQVLNAEKWASLAWLDGKSYPATELTEDWKKVLFGQFHDLAAGSGIGVIYKDMQKDYDVVRWSTNEIDAGALENLTAQIDTSSGKHDGQIASVVVFNPLSWIRSGEVTFRLKMPTPMPNESEPKSAKPGTERADNKMPPVDSNPYTVYDPATDVIYALNLYSKTLENGIQEFSIPVYAIPAFGYRVLQIKPACAGKNPDVHFGNSCLSYAGQDAAKDAGSSWVMENDSLRFVVEKNTGCITSIFDKRSNFETLAPGACGNQLQAFKDTPKDYDAWNIDPGTLDQPPALLTKVDSVEPVQIDGGFAGLRITRTWQNSKFVQTISLGRRSDQIDIDNEIDWHESHVLLKAAFPLAASGPFATYEIPYGSIDRPTTRNNSWEKAQFEVPAMRWADLGDGKHGLSVINNSKYGYDAVGNQLRLTLLRSPKWPDAEADMGHHHFHYALYPHAGTWKDALTVRHGYEYNYPLTAVVTTAHAGSLPAQHSFASVTPENVVLTAVKKAEDAKGLIFRVYEWAGKESTVEFHVPAGATGATVTNLMETLEGSALPLAGDVVKAPIHPYEILTIRVDYPKGGPRE